MTSRKLPFKDDEIPTKRCRVDTGSEAFAGASFESLNSDCVLCIASFLPLDDLNTFGTISPRFRDIRRHESLNQTRTATIICSRSNRSTADSLCAALDAAGSVLSAHYKHIKIMGLDILEEDPVVGDRAPIRLPHVTKVELALNLNETREDSRIISEPMLSIIPAYLPNVEELVFSGVNISDTDSPNRCYQGLSKLRKVSYVGGGSRFINIMGWDFSQSSSLQDLSLDGCCFLMRLRGAEGGVMGLRDIILRQYSEEQAQRDDEDYLLEYCRQIQRLSMKGATWNTINQEDEFDTFPEPEPIAQEMIIKMVRHTPTLRWLRSDLSDENVAMLKQERPEITFVSD